MFACFLAKFNVIIIKINVISAKINVFITKINVNIAKIVEKYTKSCAGKAFKNDEIVSANS